MGRKKKYTPGTLGDAVDAYFRSISRTVSATELVDTGRRDKKGHPIMKPQTICNDDGDPIKYREFLLPPSITALCLHLGISKQTWANYSADPKFLDPTTRARETVEAWLHVELDKRTKGTDGIKFDLQQNFGWSEKISVDATAGALERYLADHAGEPKDEF